jgi:hypothetical protein
LGHRPSDHRGPAHAPRSRGLLYDRRWCQPCPRCWRPANAGRCFNAAASRTSVIGRATAAAATTSVTLRAPPGRSAGPRFQLTKARPAVLRDAELFHLQRETLEGPVRLRRTVHWVSALGNQPGHWGAPGACTARQAYVGGPRFPKRHPEWRIRLWPPDMRHRSGDASQR